MGSCPDTIKVYGPLSIYLCFIHSTPSLLTLLGLWVTILSFQSVKISSVFFLMLAESHLMNE